MDEINKALAQYEKAAKNFWAFSYNMQFAADYIATMHLLKLTIETQLIKERLEGMKSAQAIMEGPK